MKIAQTVAEILDSHVTLEVECIDRMYLNLYVAGLQHVNGAVGFFRYHRKQVPLRAASMTIVSPWGPFCFASAPAFTSALINSTFP